MKALEYDLVLYWSITVSEGGCHAFIDGMKELQDSYAEGSREYCAIKTLRELALYKAQAFQMLDNQQAYFKG